MTRSRGVRSAKRFVAFAPMAAILCVAFASCVSIPFRRLEEMVARDAVLVDRPRDAKGLPSIMIEAMRGKRLILAGEQHYVLEHREFLVNLMGALTRYGMRTLAIEEQGANSWIAEDYCFGRLEALPATSSIIAWRRVLDGIRALNATLPESEKIRCITIDVNHWSDAFKASLVEMIATVGSENLKGAANVVLNASIGGPDYISSLETLAEARIDGLVEPWNTRLAELARLELFSVRLRSAWSDEAREAKITEQVFRIVDRLPQGEGLVANVGAFHAQLVAFDSGPGVKPMGARLVLPKLEGGIGRGDIFSVAFVASKGVQKESIMSAARFNFDVSESMDLSGAIARVAGDRDCYLPLTAEDWKGGIAIASWGAKYLTRPGAQYDAYYVYPVISVDPDATLFER